MAPRTTGPRKALRIKPATRAGAKQPRLLPISWKIARSMPLMRQPVNSRGGRAQPTENRRSTPAATAARAEARVRLQAFTRNTTKSSQRKTLRCEELDRLRSYLDKQLNNLSSIVSRLANRLQRRLLAQQSGLGNSTRRSILDPARLPRVIADPRQPLSFKREKDMEFRDTVVTLLIDNSGSMRGVRYGCRHLRRYFGPHIGAVRRQGRNPRLHDPRVEGRSIA